MIEPGSNSAKYSPLDAGASLIDADEKATVAGSTESSIRLAVNVCPGDAAKYTNWAIS